MKKIIILWAFILSLCVAYAQGPGSGWPCPSMLYFQPLHETGKAHKYKLRLAFFYNKSQNLNSFNIKISKPDSARWVVVDKENDSYFTAKGYGKNILARWEGKTDEEREEELSQLCDVFSFLDLDGSLIAFEVLRTSNCRFFPAGVNIAVGEFAVDLTDCEDGSCIIEAINKDYYYAFYYIGGVEGDCMWTADDPVVLELYKQGDLVSIYPWFPMDDYDGVEEVEKDKSVASVRYYNLAGVESAQPVKGVNLKVTTYSDGTTKSEKIMR